MLEKFRDWRFRLWFKGVFGDWQLCEGCGKTRMKPPYVEGRRCPWCLGEYPAFHPCHSGLNGKGVLGNNPDLS